MKLFFKGLLLFSVLFLVSCADTSKGLLHPLLKPFEERPTPEEIKEAYQKNKFGKKPDHYKEKIKKYMEDKLFDPYSAVYSDWTEPFKAWQYIEGFDFVRYGWGVCVSINAKNLNGAYTGKKRYFFFFQDNKVVDYVSGNEAEKRCRKFLNRKEGS